MLNIFRSQALFRVHLLPCHCRTDQSAFLFREDHRHGRKDNAPENLGILRHMGINLLKKKTPKLHKKDGR
jgi:predicted transposase YbfD/YdcC